MKLGVKFTISAIQSGMKSSVANADPQLLVKSTNGQFTITSAVSKALGIAAGENVMFLNNLDGIEAALANPSEEIANYAAEQGWDLNTREGVDAFVKDQLTWYIAKGVLLYKPNGSEVLATVRVSKEDKLAYIKEHGLEMIQGMDEETKAQFAAAHELEGASDEELAEAITVEDVPSPTYHAASGSKTATTSSATGTGLQLNFTDSSIWASLKADIEKDNREKVNRVFDVKLDESETVKYHNGKELVDVLAYPIEFKVDKAPLSRGAKAATDDDAE